MNVVDSSAWLSYFAGDTNADEFATPIEDIGSTPAGAIPVPPVTAGTDNDLRLATATKIKTN